MLLSVLALLPNCNPDAVQAGALLFLTVLCALPNRFVLPGHLQDWNSGLGLQSGSFVCPIILYQVKPSAIMPAVLVLLIPLCDL